MNNTVKIVNPQYTVAEMQKLYYRSPREKWMRLKCNLYVALYEIPILCAISYGVCYVLIKYVWSDLEKVFFLPVLISYAIMGSLFLCLLFFVHDIDRLIFRQIRDDLRERKGVPNRPFTKYIFKQMERDYEEAERVIKVMDTADEILSITKAEFPDKFNIEYRCGFVTERDTFSLEGIGNLLRSDVLDFSYLDKKYMDYIEKLEKLIK